MNVEKCKLFSKPRSRPDPSKFPQCDCGDKTFAMLDADERGFYLAACEACGKEFIFGIVNGEAKVVPNIDDLPD
jgi:hypothetical protein